jgi:hypothetical protein
MFDQYIERNHAWDENLSDSLLLIVLLSQYGGLSHLYPIIPIWDIIFMDNKEAALNANNRASLIL